MTELQLEKQCRRAAAEVLDLDWGQSLPAIRNAVQEVVGGSALSNVSLEFLLKESRKLPATSEPARRLNDLVNASTALRSVWKRRHLVEMMRRGAA